MLVGFLVAAMALMSGADPQTDPGKAAYVRARCDYCHGPTGNGAMGPGLVPYGKSAATLLWVVRRGIGLMPAHGAEFVSDAEVEAIYRFLRTPPAPAPAPPLSPELATAIERLDRTAFIKRDAAAVELLRADLRRLEGETTGRERRLTRYARALLGWRDLVDGTAPEGDTGREVVAAEAAGLLREVIATEESFAEAHALLAAMVALQMIRSPSWPQAVERRVARERALALGPDNPRVSLLAGITALKTPRWIGGGPAEAERHLRRAILLFDRPQSNAWPNWGEAETWRWLGELLAAEGYLRGARDAYARALRLTPDFPLVRDVLLPRLESANSREGSRR